MISTQNNRPKYLITQSDVEGYTRIKHAYVPTGDRIELCTDLLLLFSASQDNTKVPVICSMGPSCINNHAATFGLPQTPIYAEMYKQIKPLGPDACFELCGSTIWAHS